jgi:hypothetical protein
MPRTTKTTVDITRAGLILPKVAAPATDLQFLNTGTEFLAVEISTGSVVVSLVIADKVDGVTPAPKTVTVAAGAPVLIGPFPTGIYNQPGGLMFVDLAATADVTLDVVRLPGVRE